MKIDEFFISFFTSKYILLNKLRSILKDSISNAESTFYSSLMIKLHDVLNSSLGLIFFFIFSFNNLIFFLN
jgi:hypothetical protein